MAKYAISAKKWCHVAPLELPMKTEVWDEVWASMLQTEMRGVYHLRLNTNSQPFSALPL